VTAIPPPERPEPPNDDRAETVAAWAAWFEAAARPDIDAGLRDLYARLDAEVSQRGPTCWTSGKCCRFDEYGHRLYVTALEIAWVVRQVGLPPPDAGVATGRHALTVLTPNGRVTGGACAYQADKLCSIHANRPLGCRVFFCEKGTEAWQHELYERFLGELRALHDRQGIEYRYMEWRAGLAESSCGR
jgi:Fe-S-cluster containining protein